MHKVMCITDYAMTRDVKLKNTETGTIDDCFDDSSLVSEENFDFIKLGNEYSCKIKLFGEVASNFDDKILSCKIVRKDVTIGKRRMVQVLVNKDLYYIPQREVEKYEVGDSVLFCCTRKDLIQVDDVIHGDLR